MAGLCRRLIGRGLVHRRLRVRIEESPSGVRGTLEFEPPAPFSPSVFERRLPIHGQERELQMRLPSGALELSFILLIAPSTLLAQSQFTSSQPSISVPRLVKLSGIFKPADGQPPAPVEIVTVSIYAQPDGGVPLWQEMQTVILDKTGRYTVLVGASHPDGLPPEVFGSGEAQWMSVQFARDGGVEPPRIRVVSVPYAFRALDAETLGGHPASDYVWAPNAAKAASHTSGTAKNDP